MRWRGMGTWGAPLRSQFMSLLLGLAESKRRVEFKKKKKSFPKRRRIKRYSWWRQDQGERIRLFTSLTWHGDIVKAKRVWNECFLLIQDWYFTLKLSESCFRVSLVNGRRPVLGALLSVLPGLFTFFMKEDIQALPSSGEKVGQNKVDILTNLPFSGGDRWYTSEYIICCVYTSIHWRKYRAGEWASPMMVIPFCPRGTASLMWPQ